MPGTIHLRKNMESSRPEREIGRKIVQAKART
jgi:hypothetical protein